MVAPPHRKKSVCCTRTICADASQASTLPLIRASTVYIIIYLYLNGFTSIVKQNGSQQIIGLATMELART